MTAGHDLRREDEPIPDLELIERLIVAAVALVHTASPASMNRQRVVEGRRFDDLVAAIDAAGLGKPSPEPAAGYLSG